MTKYIFHVKYYCTTKLIKSSEHNILDISTSTLHRGATHLYLFMCVIMLIELISNNRFITCMREIGESNNRIKCPVCVLHYTPKSHQRGNILRQQTHVLSCIE